MGGKWTQRVKNIYINKNQNKKKAIKKKAVNRKAADYKRVWDCPPRPCALLLLSGVVMYGQLLEEAAVLPAAGRECWCHKINVGAAQQKIEITPSGIYLKALRNKCTVRNSVPLYTDIHLLKIPNIKHGLHTLGCKIGLCITYYIISYTLHSTFNVNLKKITIKRNLI